MRTETIWVLIRYGTDDRLHEGKLQYNNDINIRKGAISCSYINESSEFFFFFFFFLRLLQVTPDLPEVQNYRKKRVQEITVRHSQFISEKVKHSKSNSVWGNRYCNTVIEKYKLYTIIILHSADIVTKHSFLNSKRVVLSMT